MSLKNLEIDVLILGSGTCVPSLERSSCSVLLETGPDRVLFDLGAGTMRRLLEAGISIFDITHVFFSHFHPDHCAELVPFLFANKYADGNQRRYPLTVVGAKGVAGFYAGLKKVYGHVIELPPGLLNVVELDAKGCERRQFDNFLMESLPVEHTAESAAYKITGANGISVVYSGDTDYSENLIVLSQDTDLLICEASFPDDQKVAGHLTPSLAGRIATRANVRKLVLTHFYPECDKTDIARQCRKTYSGPLVLAHDLMKIRPAAT